MADFQRACSIPISLKRLQRPGHLRVNRHAPYLSLEHPMFKHSQISYQYMHIFQVNPQSFPMISLKTILTWGRGWMTKANGVGERRKGRGELRRDCHHRVAALFVPTRMQQWYIDIWYITMIYMGEGAGGGPFAGKITWCPWGAPEYVLKQEDSSELTLAFVIMTIIANNDKM